MLLLIFIFYIFEIINISKHSNSPKRRRRRRRKKIFRKNRLNTPASNDGKLDLIRCLSIFIRIRREASIFDTIYLYISIFLAYTNIKYNPVGNVPSTIFKNLHVFQCICLVWWKSRSLLCTSRLNVSQQCGTQPWQSKTSFSMFIF